MPNAGNTVTPTILVKTFASNFSKIKNLSQPIEPSQIASSSKQEKLG